MLPEPGTTSSTLVPSSVHGTPAPLPTATNWLVSGLLNNTSGGGIWAWVRLPRPKVRASNPSTRRAERHVVPSGRETTNRRKRASDEEGIA